MPEARFWRVRMKVRDRGDVSTTAWDRGEVGIWYGAWSAEELKRARQDNPREPWVQINGLEHQQALEWGNSLDISTIERFEKIGPDDWVVVFLSDRAQFGLAHLEPEMHSADDHELNQPYPTPGVKEVFKFRRTINTKVFRIEDLPDAYHLLAAQGRGNVHEFHGMRNHVRLLAESKNVQEVRATLSRMPYDDLIDFLGASAWESVCTAYLTLEHGFVPTGLSTGYTLPIFDIVGRRVPDGLHILAQCKKNPYSVAIDSTFAETLEAYEAPHKAFYFAFGGCHGTVPPSIEIIDRTAILAWAETERGSMFRRFMLGE